jgi:hypothetical protein
VKWGIVDQNNIVQNSGIVWDGIKPLPDLPSDLTVMQINDWLNKGDDVNAPQPPPDPDDGS